MKKILFLIAPLFIVLFACNDNKDKGNGYDDYKNNKERDDNKNNNRDRDEEDADSRTSLLGKWRIIDFEGLEGEEMSEEEKERMRSSTIEFKRDGSYTATTRDGDGEPKKEYGTYEYDAKEKKLVTVEEDGKREKLEVRFSGRSRMTLTFDEGKVTMEKD